MDFKKKAILKHGTRYDYTNSVYINARTKISIGCKLHGEFLQIPRKHISGQGCPKCSGNILLTTSEFIERANLAHRGKYYYDKAEYVNANEKIIIICDVHGEFKQTATAHLNQRQGCPHCGHDVSKTKRVTNNATSVIERAITLYGNLFEYNVNDYIGFNVPMKIKCTKHDMYFYQSMGNHLANKNGCIDCQSEISESAGVAQIKEWLNNNQISYVQEYRFNDCRNTRPLPFDFFIPSLNCLLEYDGIQHFSSSSWGGEEALCMRIINDDIKTKYCKANDINLIRIRYDENVVDILNQIFYNKD